MNKNNNEYMREYMKRYRLTTKGQVMMKSVHKGQILVRQLRKQLPHLMRVVEQYLDKHLA